MPDIEGVPYEASGGKVDQATAQALAARHREAASAGVGAVSAAIAPVQAQVSALSSRVDSQDAKTLAGAKAYTDTKVTGLATTAAMQAGDALTLSNAKTYTDSQLADFDSFVGVPIFETLTEAQAWEAANPGKKALTLEPSTPDTTAPTPGTLSVTPGYTTATLTVSGASDDRTVAGYAFQVGAIGMWSSWQSSPSYTATGLTGTTSYQFRHKVKDAAGNEALGAAVTATTTAKPPLQAGDIITSDAYTSYADGTVLGGKFTDATLGGEPMQYGSTGTAQVSGGNAVIPVKSNGVLLTVDRQDRELSLTVRATSADDVWVVVRADGSARIILVLKNNGVIGTVLQGPAGPLNGPGLPSGSYKVGDRIAFGVAGNTGYVSINGVQKLELPDLRGNTFPMCGVVNAGAGFAWDDLVVKAL